MYNDAITYPVYAICGRLYVKSCITLYISFDTLWITCITLYVTVDVTCTKYIKCCISRLIQRMLCILNVTSDRVLHCILCYMYYIVCQVWHPVNYNYIVCQVWHTVNYMNVLYIVCQVWNSTLWITCITLYVRFDTLWIT